MLLMHIDLQGCSLTCHYLQYYNSGKRGMCSYGTCDT